MAVIPDMSLAEVLERTDAVLVVRVNKRLGTQVIDLAPELMRAEPGLVLAEPLLVPFSDYEVTPVEVLKPFQDIAVGSTVQVVSRGGTGRFGGVTVREDTRTPPLVEGRQYLLFLNFTNSVNELLFTALGVFDIGGQEVSANEMLAATQHGKAVIGLSRQEALRQIRLSLAEKPQADLPAKQ